MNALDQSRQWRGLALHLARVLLFATVIGLIHLQHVRLSARSPSESLAPLDVSQVQKFYPAAASFADQARGHAGRKVLDESGQTLGYVLQTSPDSDHLIGFSGPTNTLIAFGGKPGSCQTFGAS